MNSAIVKWNGSETRNEAAILPCEIIFTSSIKNISICPGSWLPKILRIFYSDVEMSYLKLRSLCEILPKNGKFLAISWSNLWAAHLNICCSNVSWKISAASLIILSSVEIHTHYSYCYLI